MRNTADCSGLIEPQDGMRTRDGARDIGGNGGSANNRSSVSEEIPGAGALRDPNEDAGSPTDVSAVEVTSGADAATLSGKDPEIDGAEIGCGADTANGGLLGVPRKAASSATNAAFERAKASALAAWCLAALAARSQAAVSCCVRSDSTSTSAASSAVVRRCLSRERAALSRLRRRRLCNIRSCSSRDIFLLLAAVVPVRSANSSTGKRASSSLVSRLRRIFPEPRFGRGVVVVFAIAPRSGNGGTTVLVISPGDTGEAHKLGECGVGDNAGAAVLSGGTGT